MSNISPDSLNRQAEINDWYYKYRLDILFILQLVFIGISFTVFMSVLSKYRILSPVFVVYFTIFVGLLLILIWYFKYSFNNNIRDLYHWDKRKFPNDGKLESSVSPAVQQAMNDILQNCKR
jgi:hypothetical protein